MELSLFEFLVISLDCWSLQNSFTPHSTAVDSFWHQYCSPAAQGFAELTTTVAEDVPIMRVVEENKQKAVTMKPIEIILAIELEKRVKTLYIILSAFTSLQTSSCLFAPGIVRVPTATRDFF